MTATAELFKMKTILVVDDELKIIKLLRDYLERAGYGVRTAFDGKTALATARSEKPDLILLDLGLPRMDGLDVTHQLRKFSNVPIIMLTARSEESDKLVGLEIGADDYITKPFSPKEVVARIRAVFRRVENYSVSEQETVRVADLTLDLPRMRVSAEGRKIEELTPSEFQLLAAMARYPGRVFTRNQLLETLRGVAFESYERAIDAHIKNIRHKIEPIPSDPRYLLTVYGVGYKFSDQ
jgi:two-component system, OmpR family, alkaline phosphatase synthesis response regulator PhoP